MPTLNEPRMPRTPAGVPRDVVHALSRIGVPVVPISELRPLQRPDGTVPYPDLFAYQEAQYIARHGLDLDDASLWQRVRRARDRVVDVAVVQGDGSRFLIEPVKHGDADWWTREARHQRKLNARQARADERQAELDRRGLTAVTAAHVAGPSIVSLTVAEAARIVEHAGGRIDVVDDRVVVLVPTCDLSQSAWRKLRSAAATLYHAEAHVLAWCAKGRKGQLPDRHVTPTGGLT